ncbi:DUF2268 domain-containing protein [Peribacillus sp. SCS-26]|uniref:DUF2268 domain-containing protein n=1 Tax=Paraperibacillus marinus TaxID=3115295 RepID=UPI003906445E
MGVIHTDKWLKEHLDNPLQLCGRFKKLFNESSEQLVYQYLVRNGMYRYSRRSRDDFQKLQEKKVWEKISSHFSSYRKKWKGPDIPVFIFPHGSTGILDGGKNRKSGLAFKDKIFLFYAPGLRDKELEAVFVHEYHHVCRLHAMKKDMQDYGLGDSIVLEGLAEQAVEQNVGPDFLADWTKLYSPRETLGLGKKYIAKNLSVKKTEPLHDQLLYGGGRVPKMLGYCTGYMAVLKYAKEKGLEQEDTFTQSSAEFLSGYF